ncbi:MAG: GDP-mannose 4,6-dehydratase [Candidatus Omnitrophica bacterium]|nr:GDP-mannose 4,6-dehydratase [Candidatus Omnitrophota bacterium]
MKIKKILVTGGAGFLGLHLVDAFLARGVKVRVMDNFMASSRENFKGYLRKVDFREADVRDEREVKKAAAGVDVVFHFAAIRSVVRTIEEPLLAHEVNATGTLLLLHHASKAGIRHFIFTSTSAVYGEAPAARQREDGKLEPISPYGMAKRLAEHYAQYYYREKRLPTTCVRIFNVYGPRQNPESKYSLVIPAVLSGILKNRAPIIDGAGGQERDFVYVGDVLEAFFRILGNPKAFGQIYNLGFGKAYPIRTLVEKLLKWCGSDLKPIHGPRRPGDPDRTCADIGKIRREIGWAPKISLDEGLRRTVEWARKEF